MTKTEYKLGFFRKAFNTVFKPMIRLGVAGKGDHILITRGRKSGLERQNPVHLVWVNDKTWLVAPYGEVSWVHNARAAGTVRLRRGRSEREYRLREVGPEEAGPVLKKYVRQAPVVLPFFDATKDSPPEEFAKEAARHPVFELLPNSGRN